MEFLVILLFIGGVIALIAISSAISRHSHEIRELRHRQSDLQAAIDWLAHSQAAREQVRPKPQPTAPKSAVQPEFAAEQVPAVTPVPTEPAAARPRRVKPAAEGPLWKCPFCNGDIPIGTLYCTHCGVSLPIDADEQPVPERIEPRPAPPQPTPTQPVTREWWGDFEQVIGKRWMTWVGVLILIAAAAFAVKYMFDIGLLGPWVRVGLEFALGLLVLFLGRYALRHNMVALGHGLLGLGLAVFYVSLYAAYYFHHLLSVPLVLSAIAAVTAVGLLIALSYDALAVAVLATLGGMITPQLVSRGADLQHVLFAYILVLDLGVLAVALFKRWRILDIVAFVGTALIFTGWAATYYSVALLVPTMIWLSGFYAVFLLLPFVSSLRRRQPLEVEQLLLALVNAAVMIAASWHFLLPAHQGLLGLITLLMALAYLLLAVEFKLRLPADEPIHYTLLALAIFCVTLSVPLLLSFNAITITWALEAPLLVLLGYYFGNRLVRTAGFAVLLVDLLRVFSVHLPLHRDGFSLFFNAEFGTVAFIPLAAGAMALVHYFFSSRADSLDNSLKLLSGVGAGLLGLLLINLELSLWFRHSWAGSAYDARYLAVTTLLLVWVTGAALFMLAGIYWRSRAARALSLILLLVPAALGVWAYAGMAEYNLADQADYLLFANYRFFAALIAVLLVMGLGWLHAQLAAELPDDERPIPPLLGIAGGLLGLLLFAGEIGYWWMLHGAQSGPLLRASLSWQALVWAAGAVLFMLAGIRFNSGATRLAGLLPLLAGLFTVLRAYALAGGGLPAGTGPQPLFINLRFIAALAVILAVYAYGYFIRRNRDSFNEGEQQLATAAYATADVVLLILLSVEVYGYCAALKLPGYEPAQLAQLSLSVVWGVYALAFIIAGFWLRQRAMRLSALALFGLTALKLLLVDLGYLEPAYRLLSTVVLGLLMLGTSYLYHHVEKRLKGYSPPDVLGLHSR